MRKSLLLVFAAFTAANALAWFGSGPPEPDAKQRDEVSFARRGSLGKDSYVVTNVVPELPAFTLVTNPSTNLVNRACQRIVLDRDTTLVFPPPPPKREVDVYRSARSIMLSVVVTNPVPRVSFVGMNRLVTACSDSLDLVPGENLFFFSEIADGDFLVEMRQITEIEK